MVVVGFGFGLGGRLSGSGCVGVVVVGDQR